MVLFGPNVEKLKANRDIGGLTKVLESKKPEQRKDAAEALSQIGTPECLAGLLIGLRDPDARVRFYAVTGLSKIKQEAAQEALRNATKDPDWEVRKEALTSLIKAGANLSLLQEAAKFNSPELRELAVVRLGEAENPEAIEILISALQDDEEVVRLRAANALKKKLNSGILQLEMAERVRKAVGK